MRSVLTFLNSVLGTNDYTQFWCTSSMLLIYAEPKVFFDKTAPMNSSEDRDYGFARLSICDLYEPVEHLPDCGFTPSLFSFIMKVVYWLVKWLSEARSIWTARADSRIHERVKLGSLHTCPWPRISSWYQPKSERMTGLSRYLSHLSNTVYGK